MFKKIMLMMSLSMLSLQGMERKMTGKRGEAAPAGELIATDRNGNWRVATYDRVELPVEIIQESQRSQSGKRKLVEASKDEDLSLQVECAVEILNEQERIIYALNELSYQINKRVDRSDNRINSLFAETQGKLQEIKNLLQDQKHESRLSQSSSDNK